MVSKQRHTTSMRCFKFDFLCLLGPILPLGIAYIPGKHSICESRKVKVGAVAAATPSNLARIRPCLSSVRRIRTFFNLPI